MKILTVSDKVEKSFFKEHLLREKCEGIDLILGCGDLPPYYLEYLMNYPAAELRGIIAMRSLQIISAVRGISVYRFFLGL